MRLIDYTSEFLSLINVLTYSEDEAEQEQAMKQLDAIEGDMLNKADSCAWVYREFLAEAEAYKVEADRLYDKAKRSERNAEKLKNYIGFCLRGEALKTKSFTFSFRKSESVEITNPDLVPEQYQRVKTVIEPDKTLIKTDLKSGAIIEGCALIEKQNLQIK